MDIMKWNKRRLCQNKKKEKGIMDNMLKSRKEEEITGYQECPFCQESWQKIYPILHLDFAQLQWLQEPSYLFSFPTGQ